MTKPSKQGLSSRAMDVKTVYDERIKPQVIRLQFAQPLKQVGPNTIEIEVEPLHGPIFTQEAVKAVHEAMGINRGEIMLDEVANDMLRRQILDAVR